MSLSLSVPAYVLSAFEEGAKQLAIECIKSCALRHGFDAYEEMVALGLDTLKIKIQTDVNLNPVSKKKRKVLTQEEKDKKKQETEQKKQATEQKKKEKEQKKQATEQKKKEKEQKKQEKEQKKKEKEQKKQETEQKKQETEQKKQETEQETEQVQKKQETEQETEQVQKKKKTKEKMAELELKDAIKHGRPISKFVTDNLSEEVIEEYGEILDTLDYEEDKVHDKFTRIIIDGKQYLKNKSNVLFDISTKEKVGIYNERKIELFDTTRLMQLCVANLKCKL